MAAVISAEGVGHVYKNGTVALDDVNLEIGTGLFGLLGSNGAGKSTLMRAICTLLVPARGRVTVGGFDVVADRRAVRGLLGYLPQHFSAWRLQTVTEVLERSLALGAHGPHAAQAPDRRGAGIGRARGRRSPQGETAVRRHDAAARCGAGARS